MNKENHSPTNDELDLSLETLKQWEDELDQFAAGIRQRLAKLTGKKIDTSGLMPHKQPADSDQDAAYDNSEALQLLQSIREMTQ